LGVRASDDAVLLLERLAEWGETLRRLSSTLKSTTGSTEQEFLDIGARLYDFQQRSGRIITLSEQVIHHVSGDETREKITGLQTVLERLQAFLGEVRQEADDSVSALQHIGALLALVNDPLSGFKKINRLLGVLGTSTKIESARLGDEDAGFNALAEDVGKLSILIEAKSANIIAEKDKLGGLISQTLGDLTDEESREQQLVTEIIENTRGNLAKLSSIHGMCAGAASTIGEVSTDVSASISDVVVAMQSHDITRQQMEHVYEAFDDLIPRIDAIHAQPGGKDAEATSIDICHISELQLAQLVMSRDEFIEAIQGIISNLESISSLELEMNRQAREMLGVADETGGSFFADMEKGLAHVAEVLADFAEANKRLTDALNSVADTVGHITRFVGDIEDIGAEIELIALNSQIKSAHTGEKGAALGVLAEAIQKLSVDARDQTRIVSESLRKITTESERMCGVAQGETVDIQQEVEEMLSRLKGMLSDVGSLSEELRQELYSMDQLVQCLAEDIGQAIAGISVHDRISAIISEIVRELEGMVKDIRTYVSVPAVAHSAERLADLSSRYTMHSERKVHEKITKGVHGLPVRGRSDASSAPQPAKAVGDDLGDNIELF
jgi:methyl-accepting chemotaxis protein